MKHFTIIASEALKLHNFHLTFAIAASFQCHAVFRLKELKGVLDTHHQRVLDNISKVTSSDENYKAYRTQFKNCVDMSSPCLPHLALAFKDLFVFEETTAYEREHGRIDFHRLERVSNEISSLLSCTKREYLLKSNSILKQKLLDGIQKTKDDTQLQERSLQLEPKRSWAQHREHVQQLTIDVLLEEGFL